jgi:hypothetical protein
MCNVHFNSSVTYIAVTLQYEQRDYFGPRLIFSSGDALGTSVSAPQISRYIGSASVSVAQDHLEIEIIRGHR